ncbi:hypothetical protein ES332_D12G056000v1 [Gossypium tomentosum]|uniref:Uncharacterized protein n=1 Tax=Gossypium tomentosum TaxID=34277 RepID=A0A5D2I575_GOSTO|nr:hypothetical protein ES332_D12G056000v1 [Gossypium tomentosum]
MLGKHLRRAHLEKFNWVELAERELKIEQVVDIKRFVRSSASRVVGIVESVKRERVRGRVKEGWEKGLFGRFRKESHYCKI